MSGIINATWTINTMKYIKVFLFWKISFNETTVDNWLVKCSLIFSEVQLNYILYKDISVFNKFSLIWPTYIAQKKQVYKYITGENKGLNVAKLTHGLIIWSHSLRYSTRPRASGILSPSDTNFSRTTIGISLEQL